MTHRSRLSLVIAVAAGFACVPTMAQQVQGPEHQLRSAIATLDSAETERGAEMLRTLLSSAPLREALALRVEAHMYLGAASWALGMEDSAAVHLREVVRLDPFYVVDLDLFNPELSGLYHSLRLATTAIRLRPPNDTTLAPGQDRYEVAVGVGRPGNVTVRLRNLAVRTGVLLATMSLDDTATVSVPLTASDGSVLEPGSYELEAEVTTDDGRQTDLLSLTVERLVVDTMDHEPPVPEASFLPEERRGRASLLDVGRGLGFGLVATALPTLLGNRDLRDSSVPTPALTLGLAIAVADIVAARPMQPITENVDHNQRLVAEWQAANNAIAVNNDRLRREARLRIRVGGVR